MSSLLPRSLSLSALSLVWIGAGCGHDEAKTVSPDATNISPAKPGGEDAPAEDAGVAPQNQGQGGQKGEAGRAVVGRAGAGATGGAGAGARPVDSEKPGVAGQTAGRAAEATGGSGGAAGSASAGSGAEAGSAGTGAAGEAADAGSGGVSGAVSAVAGAGAGASGAAGSATGPLTPVGPADWLPDASYKLVFSDEFEGTEFDYARWCTRLPWPGNVPLELDAERDDPACTGADHSRGTRDFLKQENQRYVVKNTLGESTHVVSDGTLKLRATKTRSDMYNAYESGLIRSRFSFVPSADTKYYIVSRVRLPDVKGTFVAMWMMSGFGAIDLAWPPEIDIFEGALNEKEDTADMLRLGAHVSINGPQTKTGAVDFVSYSAQFNPNVNNYRAAQSVRNVWITFSAEWTAERVCYYIDGTNVMCENYHWVTPTGEAANPAQLILNLAIGDEWAGRYGIDDTKIPTALEIDYARIYATTP